MVALMTNICLCFSTVLRNRDHNLFLNPVLVSFVHPQVTSPTSPMALSNDDLFDIIAINRGQSNDDPTSSSTARSSKATAENLLPKHTDVDLVSGICDAAPTTLNHQVAMYSGTNSHDVGDALKELFPCACKNSYRYFKVLHRLLPLYCACTYS